MTRVRFVTADVFTDVRFTGNPLAVVPDARAIPEHRLLDVAREFNYSETTFVYPARQRGHTRQVRIFTPAGEVPFAGHPTLGTAHVLASIGEIALTADRTHVVFEEGVGAVPVVVHAEHGTPVFVQLSVAKLPEVGPPPPDRAGLARVLSLDPTDLLEEPWQPQAFSCGLPFLFVPLRDRAALARAQVALAEWERVLRTTWAPEIFVFAREHERPGADVHARMFAPGLSVPEDPATGSAAAALAGYLAARDPLRDGTRHWTVTQGVEMGRPSLLQVEADVTAGTVSAVRVGGASVLVSDGLIAVA